MDINLNYNAQMETIPLGDVISVDFIQGKQQNKAPTISLTNNEARGLMPFQPGGIPAAIVTGRLIVTFTHNKQEERRELIIYNNRLLQDTSAPDTFYYCMEGFKDALLMLG